MEILPTQCNGARAACAVSCRGSFANWWSPWGKGSPLPCRNASCRHSSGLSLASESLSVEYLHWCIPPQPTVKLKEQGNVQVHVRTASYRRLYKASLLTWQTSSGPYLNFQFPCFLEHKPQKKRKKESSWNVILNRKDFWCLTNANI